MDFSKAKLMVSIGFPLCHACDKDCHPKAILGISEEFQAGAELYVHRWLLRLWLITHRRCQGIHRGPTI